MGNICIKPGTLEAVAWDDPAPDGYEQYQGDLVWNENSTALDMVPSITPPYLRVKNDTEKLADAKVAAHKAAKLEANRRISAYIGKTGTDLIFAEINMSARVSELISIPQGLHPTIAQRSLTTEEHAELTTYNSVFAQVKVIRSASDTIESDIDALATVAEVEAYDIAGSPHWL